MKMRDRFGDGEPQAHATLASRSHFVGAPKPVEYPSDICFRNADAGIFDGNRRMPVLLLTARDGPKDVVRGLDAGADDYLAKPFSFDVLLARIRARTRHPGAERGKRLQVADLVLDLESHEVWRAGAPVGLTRTEFAILECLMTAAGRVVTRQMLIDTVWGPDRDIENNTLDVFMRFLRTKVDHGGHPRLIQTLRGIGYSVREQQL
jgi:two-component system response regulator MprA